FSFYKKIKDKFGSKNKKNLIIIKEQWFKEMAPKYTDRFKFAQEVDEWQKLYEEHDDRRRVSFFRMIINKEATVRILSLLIALFSLIALLISKFADSGFLVMSLEDNFFSLYKELFYLGISLFFLGYEIYYIFPEVKNSFLGYINDFNTSKEIYVKSRFDGFIVFLLITHRYEIKSKNTPKSSYEDDKSLL
ncbi:hypothetical protein, partial [Psychrobacter okhotskensis]|uniref:hypothetical protein n=1 Tax=Psychrobacter okhotskensis TaxID=212403 RepID=UPI00191AED62